MGPASVYAISATLYPKLNYDLVHDLAPVSLIANVPHVLLVNKDLPARTLPELIALAKQQPGLRYATGSGYGSSQHMAGQWFAKLAGIELPSQLFERRERAAV